MKETGEPEPCYLVVLPVTPDCAGIENIATRAGVRKCGRSTIYQRRSLLHHSDLTHLLQDSALDW